MAEIIDAPHMSRSLSVRAAAGDRKFVRDGGDSMGHSELADLNAEPPVLVDGLRGLWAAALRLR
jgi:hypothetical protein